MVQKNKLNRNVANLRLKCGRSQNEVICHGNLTNPLAIIFEGRWSYEKIGELLPIDYIP